MIQVYLFSFPISESFGKPLRAAPHMKRNLLPNIADLTVPGMNLSVAARIPELVTFCTGHAVDALRMGHPFTKGMQAILAC